MEGLAGVWVFDNGYLEVSLGHLSFKSVFQGLNRSVHSVTNVDVLCISLFKEGAGFSGTFAKSSSFPAVESAWSLNLVDLRSCLFPASHDHSYAKGTHTTRLRVLLEKVSYLSA